MAVLLETDVGDLVIDLDVEGSPRLCENFLKLCRARYYTGTLLYQVTPHRVCRAGDPTGTGVGGGCIHGILEQAEAGGTDIAKSSKRFLRSVGRRLSLAECREKGRVVAIELNGVKDTVGSQFLITLESGEGRALDGYVAGDGNSEKDGEPPTYLSLGKIAEDNDDALGKIGAAYCDQEGRPFADIRIIRALVVHDPFEDPPGMAALLESRGVVVASDDRVMRSPSPERPIEEVVAKRISVMEIEEDADEQDEEKLRQREERALRQQDKGRAVVLEMLGDLPDAEVKAPENVLFICKLNPVTVDEDLELIFSRFDEKVKVEIIRDQASGKSLQYAFAEFTEKQQAVEAYFKMNNALIDDRRIKVDFSQSVAKVWDRYNQKLRMPKAGPGGNFGLPDAAARNNGRARNDDPPRNFNRCPPHSRDKHPGHARGNHDGRRNDRGMGNNNNHGQNRNYRNERDRNERHQRSSSRDREYHRRISREDDRYRDDDYRRRRHDSEDRDMRSSSKDGRGEGRRDHERRSKSRTDHSTRERREERRHRSSDSRHRRKEDDDNDSRRRRKGRGKSRDYERKDRKRRDRSSRRHDSDGDSHRRQSKRERSTRRHDSDEDSHRRQSKRERRSRSISR